MLPRLDSNGLLPVGIHRGTVDEVVSMFCRGTAVRRALEAPLRELVDAATSVGATALFVNGSFIGAKPDPGDIDAVVVVPAEFDHRSPGAQRLVHLHRSFGFDIERVRNGDLELLDYFLKSFFAIDRDGRPRGIVEVIL